MLCSLEVPIQAVDHMWNNYPGQVSQDVYTGNARLTDNPDQNQTTTSIEDSALQMQNTLWLDMASAIQAGSEQWFKKCCNQYKHLKSNHSDDTTSINSMVNKLASVLAKDFPSLLAQTAGMPMSDYDRYKIHIARANPKGDNTTGGIILVKTSFGFAFAQYTWKGSLKTKQECRFKNTCEIDVEHVDFVTYLT